ncbi:MAG TPA: zinc-ribbon domain-containing protein [Baekduia sp.]|uniref:zinc ribbon domain-containing protein n=1 Tax=Baekduia sp. TaxID=2600305 RepID=UPI002D78371D|nr:zinc-ribbon domain-containing protein [Baekduia sp.]HET6510107.1 zinc-ribbon domain-containing protein [Baekduia sp.]
MFCSRCGASTEPDATFCERCGERLAPAPAAVVPRATTSSRPPRGVLVAGAAALVVGAVVAALALTGALDGSDHPVARRVTVPPAATVGPSQPAVTVATPTTATEGEAAPPAEAPAEPRPARAVVARTCGKGGVGGDCHLSVRASPSPDADEVLRLDEGDTLRLSCQVRGEPVRSSALGATSTVWSRTTRGGYVSNVYIMGPSLKSRSITLRRC